MGSVERDGGRWFTASIGDVMARCRLGRCTENDGLEGVLVEFVPIPISEAAVTPSILLRRPCSPVGIALRFGFGGGTIIGVEAGASATAATAANGAAVNGGRDKQVRERRAVGWNRYLAVRAKPAAAACRRARVGVVVALAVAGACAEGVNGTDEAPVDDGLRLLRLTFAAVAGDCDKDA